MHASAHTLRASVRPEASVGGPGAPTFETRGAHTRIRRAPVRAIAKWRRQGAPQEMFGQVANLSPQGCLLRTETSLEPGDVLEIEITVIGRGQRTSAKLRGKVLRRSTQGGRRAYGVAFDPADPRAKQTQQWLCAHAGI